MWTRAELKERAKEAFRRNYWICVVAGLLLSLLAGGSTSSSGSSSTSDSDFESLFEDEDELVGSLNADGELFDVFVDDETGETYYSPHEEEEDSYDQLATALGIAGIVFVVIMLIVLVIAVVYSVFVGSVIAVGGCRFFTINASQDANIKEIFSGFTGGNYMRNVSTQFLRGLYTFLWSLLFIIPGIVKGYEYLMIPYILADNPNISREEAFALSKRMMDGHKWDTFVLDLSFIGWALLSSITCGIVGLFWVDPYMRATYAELYLKLKSNVMPVQTIETNQYGWDGAERI